MQQSLTTFLTEMAPIVRVTPAMLRERQRALVLAGVLVSQPGRGRGSGVATTPETVSTLLISMLASTSLAEAAQQTKTFMEASTLKKCTLTGQRTFGNALAIVVADPNIAQRVNDVTVQIGAGTALIHFDGYEQEVPLHGAKGNRARVTRHPDISAFVTKTSSRSAFLAAITITGDTVRAIASIVAKLEADQ